MVDHVEQHGGIDRLRDVIIHACGSAVLAPIAMRRLDRGRRDRAIVI